MLPADMPCAPCGTSRRYNCSRVACANAPKAAIAASCCIGCVRAIIQYPSNHRALQPPIAVRSGGCLPGIGFETGGGDAGDGADLILVGGVAANPDRADDVARTVTDQYTTWRRHDTSTRCFHQRRQEQPAAACCAPRELAPAKPHTERPPGLTPGDLVAKDARFVLALHRDHVAAGIEDDDGERVQVQLAALGDRRVDDDRGLGQGYVAHFDLPPSSWFEAPATP